MTIKSNLAAVAVAFSVVLFFGTAAQAKEQPTPKQVEDAPVKIAIQAGDTLSSIADAHGTTYVRIFNANDFLTSPDMINAGDEVRIPKADEQLPDRYAELAQQVVAAAPVVSQVTPTPASAPRGAAPIASSSAGNTYYRGYCTWYAKERRADLPNMLGNGGQWVANAAARGYATGSVPRAGAIAEIPGHVMYVEAVNGDGTIVISEMNGPAGFGVVGTRTIAASSARYIY